VATTAEFASQTERLTPPMTDRRVRLASVLVFLAALAATAPTTGDFGLTWDEPSYRYSQIFSEQWWGRLVRARDRAEIADLFDSKTLLYYWPYGRYGINFHPPLAGQLNLLTYEIFGGFMKDIPARRMASVFEYVFTITILFSFIARRYGIRSGLIAAGALLLTPRVYADGHLAATDIPGLFLWAATSIAFWKGLYEPKSGLYRVLTGILIGLAFVEKMSAIAVAIPLVLWLIFARIPGTFFRRGGLATWIDGAITTVLVATPSAIAFAEILRLRSKFPSPNHTDLFTFQIQTPLSGWILALPVLIWLVRRALYRVFRGNAILGVERPGLEIWTSILAFAPLIGWLGNPAWWRDAIPRLTHYYMISSGRQGALPDIQIIYFGQIYEYCLPWHNAFVLTAITVPASILIAAAIGLVLFPWIRLYRGDRLPIYLLLHLLVLPVIRMFPTPAHDGVRLFLPTFFFLAAFAGLGASLAADAIDRIARAVSGRSFAIGSSVLVALSTLAPAAIGLIKIHPYELSYYNELIGGPRGAWRRGFELSYWYDAFNDKAIAEVNATLPKGASISYSSDLSQPPTFIELQSLGVLDKSFYLNYREGEPPPYMWLLTQDSKTTALTRLLFVMKPAYALRPKQLDGLRVFSIVDPVAVSRASALQLLLDRPGVPRRVVRPPDSLRFLERYPGLARFLGYETGVRGGSKKTGVHLAPPLGINEALLKWGRDDPSSLRAAARAIVDKKPVDEDPNARKLFDEIARWEGTPNARLAHVVLSTRPESFVEAVELIVRRPDALRKVMLTPQFTDPETIGGYLDRDFSSR
jgi:4-amino-4-deoxy-L-arabinose transferase-like glycosyltransferase